MFDRVFIYFMDRLVLLILFIVISNLALDITGVTAQTKESNSYQPQNIPLQNSDTTKGFESIADNIEVFSKDPIGTVTPNRPLDRSTEQRKPGRLQVLDSIFNIPIATLQAVNELVQSIAGTLQAGGTRSYFSGKLQSSTANEKPKDTL